MENTALDWQLGEFMLSNYISPKSGKELYFEKHFLVSKDSVERFQLLDSKIPDFRETNPNSILSNNDKMYEISDSVERYDNFLNWLFKTFKINPKEFREKNSARLNLKPGDKVLVTGCGLGDDIPSISKFVEGTGQIYAQDLSKTMILEAKKRCKEKNVHFSICDATNLPFPESFFDASFHFGGINLFSNITSAFSEMERVTKVGGVIIVGDESVAPWLRNIDYGKAMILNNSLWGANVPLDKLPKNARDVELSYILGNCFYLIRFKVGIGTPDVDMKVEHIGLRGGTIYSRYFGQLDGTEPELKNKIINEAIKTNQSVYEFVKSALLEKLDKVGTK